MLLSSLMRIPIYRKIKTMYDKTTKYYSRIIHSRGGGGTPYNGLYGEAPPERGTFFRLQVYKRVGVGTVLY